MHGFDGVLLAYAEVALGGVQQQILQGQWFLIRILQLQEAGFAGSGH